MTRNYLGLDTSLTAIEAGSGASIRLQEYYLGTRGPQEGLPMSFVIPCSYRLTHFWQASLKEAALNSLKYNSGLR